MVSTLYSQTELKGVVRDSVGNPISLANVQIFTQPENKLIQFISTNNLGVFEFELSTINDNFDIKITHISYFTEIISIKKNTNSVLDFNNIILKFKNTSIKEIKIIGNFKLVEDKNDTIKYNLKKLLNGSEDKLRDVLNKLPGIKIDNNGKIRFNGKVIDDLLIDGDQLYNNQHQLATENIKSIMIDKIEILKNHKKFSSFENESGSNETALNLYIKEEYKNKVNGLLELEGGYKKKYKVNGYIYNFGNKLKASLISDINNINFNILTVADYLDYKQIINREINSKNGNNTLNIDDNVPEFLFAEDDFKNKNIKNTTLNFNKKISKNTKIIGYSVLNSIFQNQNIITNQNYYATDNLILNKNSNIFGSSIYNSNYIKIENKQIDNLYFSYTISNSYNSDNQKNKFTTIFNDEESNFKENKKLESINVGQNFYFKKKISNSKKLELIVYNELSDSKNKLFLESDKNFLGLTFLEKYLLDQNTSQSRFRLGVKAKLIILNKKNNFDFHIGSSLLNEKYKNYIDELNPSFNFKIYSSQINNYFGMNYTREISAKLKISVGSDINNNISVITDYNKNNNSRLLPYSSISYSINKNISTSIDYKRNFSNYTINQFNKENVISDFRTIIRGNELINNNSLLSNQFSYNFSYANFDDNLNFFVNLIYENRIKNISYNTFSIDNNIFNENIYINLDDTLYMFIVSEKKIKNIPFGVNMQLMVSLFNKQVFSNFISNQVESFQSKFDLNCISYFKNNDFNTNFGVNISNLYSNNNELNIKNKFIKTVIYNKLNGLILNDKIDWELKGNYIIFSSSNFRINNILDISPKVILKGNKINYFISGTNILNIRDNNIKTKSSNTNSYIEQSLFNSFSGFINIGLSLSF